MSDSKVATPDLEKRGGYGSSNKDIAKLTPPPAGPAPGGRTPDAKSSAPASSK